MNVTPIDRVLAQTPSSEMNELFEYIDYLFRKKSRELEDSSRPVRVAAAYHLDNVVRPQADVNAARLKTIEKMMYFILGSILSLIVMMGLRQIEQKRRK